MSWEFDNFVVSEFGDLVGDSQSDEFESWRKSHFRSKGSYQDSGPVMSIGLNRGIIRETEKAYLCTENMWWPKSHAEFVNGELFVSRWIWDKKFGTEHHKSDPAQEYGEDGRDLAHDGVQGVDWGFYTWGDS